MRWVEARRAELLPTPYFHTVVTLPHELNPLVLANKRLLLGQLLRSASETLLDFGQSRLGGQLGTTMVLHTWDQLLKPHFHLHALVPGGALAGDGRSWTPTHPTLLFPVKALSAVFRAHYLEALQGLYAQQALRLTDATLALEVPTAFDTFVKRLRSQKWIVYAKPPFGGPEQTLSDLGRYTHRVAISNHRLLDMQGDQVRFTFRNRQQGDRVEVARLEAHTWIKRFLLPVIMERHFKRHFCPDTLGVQRMPLLGEPVMSAGKPQAAGQGSDAGGTGLGPVSGLSVHITNPPVGLGHLIGRAILSLSCPNGSLALIIENRQRIPGITPGHLQVIRIAVVNRADEIGVRRFEPA